MCLLGLYAQAHAMLVKITRLPRGLTCYAKIQREYCKKSLPKIYVKTLPQTARGALGNFRLVSKEYTINQFLKKYLKKNEFKDPSRLDIQKAYELFLGHNSADALKKALSNNEIDEKFALKALFFSKFVASSYRQYLRNSTSWSDEIDEEDDRLTNHLSNKIKKENDRLTDRLIDEIEKENDRLTDLMAILSKKYKNDEVKSYHRQSLQCIMSIKPRHTVFLHYDTLGYFDKKIHYTVQEYLKKLIVEQMGTAEYEKHMINNTVSWKYIKAAYLYFLQYNRPSHIKSKEEEWVMCNGPILPGYRLNYDRYDALLLTRQVANSLQHYLKLPKSEVLSSSTIAMEEFYSSATAREEIEKLTDKDVELFKKFGIEQLCESQTNEGLLGNFDKRRSYTIYDYLQKYLAKILEVPEKAVRTEASFFAVKKAFEMFLQHNNINEIFKEDTYITKEINSEELFFTERVVCAMQSYLKQLPLNSLEEDPQGVLEDEKIALFIYTEQLHDEIRKAWQKYGKGYNE